MRLSCQGVVLIKKVIDLRSNRYKSERSLIQPRLIILFAALFFIIALTALLWGGASYSNSMHTMLEKERAALQLLELEAYPVIELAASLEQTARTAEIIPFLLQNNIPASYCLDQIQKTASPLRVKITNISITGKEVEISAGSRAIHHATAFCEALESLDFIINASVISIELVDSSSYNFRVDGIYLPPGGVPLDVR